MTTSTLSLNESKTVVTQLLDQVPTDNYWFKYFGCHEMKELREELKAADNLENLACVLEDVMMWVPKGDWWSDGLRSAYQQANELKTINITCNPSSN